VPGTARGAGRGAPWAPRLPAALGLALGALVLAGPGGAEARPLPQPAVAEPDVKPFGMPFAVPPGPDTWLLGQPYGNSTGAYRQRRSTYAAAQGLHFGVDLTAACGLPVVAMADGVVFAADAMSFGAAPHNLMIDHPDLGYASFYGHLQHRPALAPGQAVKRGDVVAASGDPEGSCRGRPHLHFEIRDLRHLWKYNPVVLVGGVDWDSLALIGPFGRAFQRDLDAPRRWQHLDDQPDTVIGGPLLNDYARAWPPESR
jgi:murein DD-endopeptidase MepM/ murein hydrolase activator NlpD